MLYLEPFRSPALRTRKRTKLKKRKRKKNIFFSLMSGKSPLFSGRRGGNFRGGGFGGFIIHYCYKVKRQKMFLKGKVVKVFQAPQTVKQSANILTVQLWQHIYVTMKLASLNPSKSDILQQ